MEIVGRTGARCLVLVIGIILALLVAPLAAGWLTPSASLSPWRLDDAALTLVPGDGGSSDGGSLSGALPSESPVGLPDPWNRKHPGFGGTGHYRFTVRVEPGALADRALYVPRLSNHGAIEINGAPLTEPGGIGNAS